MLIMLLLSSSIAYSQISWQILGSVGLVEQRTDNAKYKLDGSFINGWQIGVHSRIYKQSFYLRPGIEFAYVDIFGSQKIEILKEKPANYSFLFPLQLGYDVIRNEDFKFRVAAGGILSYLFKVDDNKLGINKYDYTALQGGLLLSAGFDFYPICFDFNYSLGLSNLYVNPDFKTNTYSFTLGIIFDK